MKTLVNVILIIIIAAGLVYGYFVYKEFFITENEKTVENNTAGNDSTTTPVKNNAVSPDTLKITTPKPHEIVTNPIKITGEATGVWYFEGDFPVVLTDLEGNTLSNSYAKAQGDWMSETFVPFEGELTYEVTEETQAVIEFKQSDPSGMGINDASFQVPVVLSPSGATNSDENVADETTEPTVEETPADTDQPDADVTNDEPATDETTTAKECIVTGCSNQVCSEEIVVTTCEFKEEYACYAKAVCEKQADGKCGWTETDSYKECMAPFANQ
jgi:hypothetical protein